LDAAPLDEKTLQAVEEVYKGLRAEESHDDNIAIFKKIMAAESKA
jgi:hypothetical protein